MTPGGDPARRTLVRSGLLTSVFLCAALTARVLDLHTSPVAALLIYGAAVVSASFVLAWGAEAAQIDVSGGLAIAVLAVLTVLPEYSIDLYYAFVAGHNIEYAQYAAANMTGSNRLLMGLGWPLVALVAAMTARSKAGTAESRRPAAAATAAGPSLRGLLLEPSNRVELGFLLIASIAAFAIPVSGQIHVALGLALMAWFGFYLFTASRGEVEEPALIGTAAALGALPDRTRRISVIVMLVFASAAILLCAKPFAENLISSGDALGIDRFLLVQWLAPLASEAPEFIIAVIFAARGKNAAAIGMLLSSKVNQWTLLIGSLPLAHLAGGGGPALILDARQVEEVLLTTTQTVMGVALILGLRFHRTAAWTLLVLFVAQLPLTSTGSRWVLSAVYGAIALVGLFINRRYIVATLTAPFTPVADPAEDAR